MKSFIRQCAFSSMLYAMPVLVFAQQPGNQTFSTLVARAQQYIINPLIWLLFGVALVAFLWGMVKFVQSSGDGGARSEGIQMMVWGVVGMTIMFVVLQLVQITARTFGLDAQNIPSTPGAVTGQN